MKDIAKTLINLDRAVWTSGGAVQAGHPEIRTKHKVPLVVVRLRV
jgi:hypothetical protein